MAHTRFVTGALLAFFLNGCGGLAPVKLPDAHLQSSDAQRTETNIPPPVRMAPVLPKPKPSARPETYSVVVSNVRVQELLFALARDAKLNVDVHPSVTGNVTLNAIDQTLPQLLTRIARQVDMRYEVDGTNLIVMRDTPFLRNYHVDYLNMSRISTSQLGVSSQVATSASSGGSGGVGTISNNSISTVNNISNNRFWDTLVANVRDLLRESDKLIPGAQPAPVSAPATPTQSGLTPASGSAAPPSVASTGQSTTGQTANSQMMEFREAASVISNPEAGILSIRATSRQHEKIQEFLDQVMTNVKRQVLIEATIAEVQLNNQYQRGIDWSKLRIGSAGFQFQQSSGATPAGINTNAFVVGYASANQNFSVALKLLESFGDVKVLSSPKISVLNNQSAVLKVVDNLVFFTIKADTTVNQTTTLTTFTSTLNSVPVGFVMTVIPQISDSDSVVLNLRPTISRKIGDVADPNPSLTAAGVASLVPVIQTREMDSILRVQSGQVAVMGGLIQDQVSNTEDGIPGVNRIPTFGDLFRQRKDAVAKTELVIFLRPTVIRDASIDGDYRQLRNLLPDAGYLNRVNPGKAEAYGEQPAQ